ncbi:MAG: 50S ribosomal protein L6 [Candidatus Cloacimonetes bacterium]|nr:50S ribosomal protein L6 [Candidatus Cloacimonadota bacterium]
MSRIGKNPIAIPQDVTIATKKKNELLILTVKGKLGELNYTLNKGITVVQEDNNLKILRSDDSRDQKALHGLSRALIFNMIEGVNNGYEKILEVIGTGYSADRVGPWLKLILGYSHDILIEVPEDLTVETESVPRGKGGRTGVQFLIKVKGISKEDVGKFAAEVRRCRPPENYKGKGIRYQGEYVRIKAGKAGAK